MYRNKFQEQFFSFSREVEKLVGRVFDETFYTSPMRNVGLEIMLVVQFKISDDKRKYIARLREIIYTQEFPEGNKISDQKEEAFKQIPIP